MKTAAQHLRMRLSETRLLQMATHITIDPFHAVALAVPGAIAGDILNGDRESVIIGGLLGFFSNEYLQSDESPVHKAARRTFRTAPLLGLGAGYGAGRVGGLSDGQALVTGLLGAMVAMMLYTKMSKEKAGFSMQHFGLIPDEPSYPATSQSGGPPATPASLYDVN